MKKPQKKKQGFTIKDAKDVVDSGFGAQFCKDALSVMSRDLVSLQLLIKETLKVVNQMNKKEKK